MTTVEILTRLIKEFEGYKLDAYKCPAGIWTIGYGQTKGIKQGMKWTQQEVDDNLLETCIVAIDEAIKASPILLLEDINKQAAIADFVYNLGITNYNRSKLKLRINQKNWTSAVTEIKKWNKAGGDVLAGLVRRRQCEADLLLK
jgi:lysozyme